MKKVLRVTILTAIFSAILIVACKKEVNQEETTGSTVVALSGDSLKTQVDAITDSLNLSWKILNSTDSLLHADIKRLLQEISYAKQYDAIKLKQMEIKLDKFTAKRLTQASLAQSELIDQYDLASDSLVSQIIAFAVETPNFDHYPLMKRLLNDINNGNSAQVIAPNRAHYDHWAKEFNLLVTNQAEGLKALGEPYASYKIKPLFTISQ